MNSPKHKQCTACSSAIKKFTKEEAACSLKILPLWQIQENHHLWRAFTFPDFKTALDFVVKIGQIAEDEGHHPDITLCWGKVELTIWTHKVDGLTENDFIIAAKCDAVYQIKK